MEASMQQLRQLDASMEAQMSPGRPQQGAGVAAEHKQGRRGDPRQHSDRADKWSEQEQAAFVLGLYLWGKNFPSIQQLIGSKTLQEVCTFYCATFKTKPQHRRWRDALLLGGVKGEALVSGERQDRMRAQLSRSLSREGREELSVLLEHFNRCAITLNTLVMRLVEAAGRDAFVRSCNLAGTAPKVGATRVLSAQEVRCLLGSALPIKGQFWDDVWPGLNRAGWTSDHEASKPSGCVFLPPAHAGGQPQPLDSIQDVLERLHADADAASARGSPKARSQPSLFRPGPEGHAAPADAFCQLEQRPRKAQGGNAAQQPGGAPRRTAIQDAPTALPPCPADPNVKTCANCQFTTTPLWRKDRVSGMIMCNACSIYYKNHGKHRPLELIEQSRIAAGACCSATHGPNAKAAPSRGSAHPGAHDAHNEPAAPPALPPIKTEVRRLTQSHSTPSCLKRSASEMEGNAEGNTTAPNSDQDLSDGGQQRRSVRQRRARDWGDEMAPPKRAHPRGEGPSDASDEGCDDPMDEDSAAEEQRSALIDSLLANSTEDDFNGAVQALVGMKNAACAAPAGVRADPGAEQQPWGVPRAKQEPDQDYHPDACGAPHSPSPCSSPCKSEPRNAASAQRHGVAGGVRKSNLGKLVQRRNSPPVNGVKGTGTICANCTTTSTPLWRKDRSLGIIMCNACGIYYKTHGRMRPVDGVTHGLVRASSGLKRTASKGLKKRRAASLSVGAGAVVKAQQQHHSARQLERARSSAAAEQRLPRFNSGEAPSSRTASLDKEEAMEGIQTAMCDPQQVSLLQLAQLSKYQAMIAGHAGAGSWDNWQQHSQDAHMLAAKPAGLQNLKAPGAVPIKIDARAGPLPDLEAGGHFPPFKWSEEGGLVHPATPPRARMAKHPAGPMPSHLQRQGSSLGSARIVHALFAPPPPDSRPLSRSTSHL